MEINTKHSFTEYQVTTPTSGFAIGFDDFIDDGDVEIEYTKDGIHVTLNGVDVSTLGYTVRRKSPSAIEVLPSIKSGVVRIYRETNIDKPFHKFTAGVLFEARTIDENFTQVRHSQQEVRDGLAYVEGRVLPLVDGLEEALTKADEASLAAQAASEAAQEAAQTSRSASNVVDANGLNQQQINDKTITTVNSVAELIAIKNPLDGQTVRTKSYHLGLNKGGVLYQYDSSRSTESNNFTVIKGWVIKTNRYTVEMAGAKGDGVSDDSTAFQITTDTVSSFYVPSGIFLCNFVLKNSFDITGSGKGTVLKPCNVDIPIMTNINIITNSWSNDAVSDLELRSSNANGVGFSYGQMPASNDYYGVGRVVMSNVKFYGLYMGVRKINGNIGNKYYNCDFEHCAYGVHARSNQVSIPNSPAIMHSGCDYYYACNFSENTVSGVAYYDKTHGTGQWTFDSCVFQFNRGFGMFFDFDIPDNLFAPILILNTWFEENGGNQVLIDRVNGTPTVMTSLPKFVAGTNDVIVIGGEDYKTRIGIGVLNPKRTLHIHDKNVPMIQLTNDTTGSVDEFRGGQIYFSYPDLYLENKEGGRLYLSTVTGKVEIDPSGNFVSRKGKIGYAKGAGNIVTQDTNKDRSVICNTPSGRVVTAPEALAAGASVTFVLNNTYIREEDVIVVNVKLAPSGNERNYAVVASYIRNGACNITIKNNATGSLAEAIELSFVVIAGAVDPIY